MKSPDKFLVGIVVGVAVLLAVVFGVILSRPADEYQAEDTPEGVAHNYLLALQKEDYERAYGYLYAGLENYPASVTAFERDLEKDRWRFRSESSVSLSIQSFSYRGKTNAVVKVRETQFYSGSLFSSSQNSTDFEIHLVLDVDNGSIWKISDADFYFYTCWTSDNPCNYPGIVPIP